MSAATVPILVVGVSTARTHNILQELARSGWEAHSVETLQEADTVLRTVRFNLILAAEKLPDGTGYELAPLVARQAGNLFMSVPLSETCLWLPVVENGVKSLGQRAMNPMALAMEAESILRACAAPAARREASSAAIARVGPSPLGAATQSPAPARLDCEPRARNSARVFAAPKLEIPARRKTASDTPVVPKELAPLTRDDAAREPAVAGKRWRGL
ncbi:MAG: hypothetical protein WA192_16885 [Candidatus Acidiferrales bacterium]